MCEPLSRCVAGAFIKDWYIKCPHLDRDCQWRFDNNPNRYDYLRNACYLSGSFGLECPEKEKQNEKTRTKKITKRI